MMTIVECKTCGRKEPYPDGKLRIEECVKRHLRKASLSDEITPSFERHYMVYEDDPRASRVARSCRGCVDVLILAMAAGLLGILVYNYRQFQKEKKDALSLTESDAPVLCKGETGRASQGHCPEIRSRDSGHKETSGEGETGISKKEK